MLQGQVEGAKLIQGGNLPTKGAGARTGYFVRRLVFDEAENSMRICHEEIFGPVISVIRSKDFDDALNKANDIVFGLSAGIISNNLHKALRFANQIEAGVVKINESTSGVALHAPFGGFKASSANTFKEQGRSAVDFYTRIKTIYIEPLCLHF